MRLDTVTTKPAETAPIVNRGETGEAALVGEGEGDGTRVADDVAMDVGVELDVGPGVGVAVLAGDGDNSVTSDMFVTFTRFK